MKLADENVCLQIIVSKQFSNTNKQLRIQAFRDKLEIKLRKMKLALALLVLVFTITITVSERQAKIRGGGRIAR